MSIDWTMVGAFAVAAFLVLKGLTDDRKHHDPPAPAQETERGR